MDFLYWLSVLVVPGLYALAFTMIGLAPPEFGLARIGFIAATTWLAVVGSLWIWKTDPAPAIRIAAGLLIGAAVFVALPESLRWVGTRESLVPKIAYFGGLTPANEPSPPLPPGVAPDAVQLMLGDDLRILSASSNPVFTVNGQVFLSIGVRDRLMRVTTTLMDSHNQWICRVIDNEFQASQERAFNPKQPDEHSLVVRDADGVEVLNLRFLNPKAMRITGRFQVPGLSGPIQILPAEGMQWPGGGISHLTLDMVDSSKNAPIAIETRPK